MTIRLRVIQGPNSGQTFRLPLNDEVSIGRGTSADFKIDDPCVSRTHIQLTYNGKYIKLKDVGSSTGTLVNGTSCQVSKLSVGDLVQLGETTFRIDGDHDDESTLNVQYGKGRHADSLGELTGMRFQNYVLDERIATGTTGVVFKATDEKYQTQVALKVLYPEFTGNELQRDRFIRAMKTVLPLRHPNIVRILQAGKKGRYCWMAMEYIEGENLNTVIERLGIQGMLEWRTAWRIGLDIAKALEFNESYQIVHRNIAPTNILRRSIDGRALLIDPLLVKALVGIGSQHLTRPGEVLGELPYLSPERTRDGSLCDIRSDLYGLGATLYALLTARPPHQSENVLETIGMIREQPPKPIKEFQLSVPDAFADLVHKLLMKSPNDRIQKPDGVVKALTHLGSFHQLK